MSPVQKSRNPSNKASHTVTMLQSGCGSRSIPQRIKIRAKNDKKEREAGWY